MKADIFHAYVALLKQTKTALLPQMAVAHGENEMMDLSDEGPANKLLGQVGYLLSSQASEFSI